eukprot:CAMPEP_0185817854 /NCGR_PEP_ID=MMETSP1322-20130828/19765_1 /TAXON_ID=265543 /ORGANISM="Minutocellus polymorphus, Strain RCC2270" /LENGTH=79 /DNA_ID=CAMNT_0028514923 /DNA_START=18 /DNA_END=253 /DNA_ORIENTATION=-
MANLDEQWKAVSGCGRSKSLGESSEIQSKSARKNARRKERKQFERKWGVKSENAAAFELVACATTRTTGSSSSQMQSIA